MTPLQFSTLARLLYGEGWQRAAADLLNVSLRNVQHWAAGTKPIPPGVAADMVRRAGRVYRDDDDAADRIDQIARILRVITGAE